RHTVTQAARHYLSPCPYLLTQIVRPSWHAASGTSMHEHRCQRAPTAERAVWLRWMGSTVAAGHPAAGALTAGRLPRRPRWADVVVQPDRITPASLSASDTSCLLPSPAGTPLGDSTGPTDSPGADPDRASLASGRSWRTAFRAGTAPIPGWSGCAPPRHRWRRPAR